MTEDEGRLHSAPATINSHRLEDTSERGRSAPVLVVEIPFEGFARLYINAATHEDELRLREWLRAALLRRRSLSALLLKYLDQLDELEAA